MGIITCLFILTGFLSAFGIVLLWLSNKTRLDEDIKMTALLFSFGLAYLLLAHLTLVGGVGLSVSEYNQPLCEYVTNTTTLNATNNITTYTYVNSCEGLEAPTTATNVYKWLLWLVWADFLFILLGFAVFIVQWVKKLW